MDPRSKNQLDSNSFHAYCRENPDLRFWQALKNWSGFAFIFGKKSNPAEEAMDTYNIESAIQKRLEIQEAHNEDFSQE